MKKSIIFVIAFTISLTIGCTKNIENNSEIKDTSEKNNIGNQVEGKEINVNKGMNLLAFFNGKILYSESTDNKNDTTDEKYFILDLDNNKTNNIGEIKNFNISSGDFQIVNDNEVYMYEGIYKQDGLISDFIKINIQDKESTIIRSDKDIVPLVYFNELNDQEILINGAVPYKEGTGYNYYIDKYNHHTNTRENIIKSEYNSESENGKLIVSVSVNNNKIYAYVMEGSKNDTTYSIDIYDLNGKLENSIVLEGFENYLKDDTGEIESIFKFKSFKNYFYFETLNGRSILFKYDKNKLIEIELGKNNYLSLVDIYNGNLGNLSTNNVYFLNRYEDKLFSFSLDKSEMKPISIKANKSYKYTTGCLLDENGNLIVKVAKDLDYKDDSEKYYYISKESLK